MNGFTGSVVSKTFVALASCLALRACRHTETLMERDTPIRLEDTTIYVAERRAGRDGPSFIHLHEDERTSADAALDLLKSVGGRLVTLRHSGDRFITFSMGGDSFRFDPNRIFTERGAALTLEQNGGMSQDALRAVRNFADSLLTLYRIGELNVAISVHNNRPNGFNILSYVEGGEHEVDAADVHVESGRDANDFFFVTERSFFEHFRDRGFNVVLQDNEAVTDDGSLSVYCGREGIPYINVEAGHGEREEQERMLRAVADLFSTSRPV